MSAGDHARAAGREAARQARAARARLTRADPQERPGTGPQADGAPDTAGRRAVEAARAARGRALAQAAGTRSGRAIGRGVTTAGRHAGALPLLSLPRVVMEQRRGVAALVSRVSADPRDPVAAVQLAEALAVADRDGRVYRGVRTLWNPYTALVGGTLRFAGELDAPEGATGAGRILRHAYAVAVLRLREEPDDGAALHVVARVLRATGHPAAATRPCRRAVARSDSAATAGQTLYTLSDLLLATGDVEGARTAAHAAVRTGCSLGRLVLAEVVYRDDRAGSALARSRRFAELVEGVAAADEQAYWGFSRPGARTLLGAVLTDQSVRAATAYLSLAAAWDEAGGRARGAVRRRTGRADAPSAAPPGTGPA